MRRNALGALLAVLSAAGVATAPSRPAHSATPTPPEAPAPGEAEAAPGDNGTAPAPSEPDTAPSEPAPSDPAAPAPGEAGAAPLPAPAPVEPAPTDPAPSAAPAAPPGVVPTAPPVQAHAATAPPVEPGPRARRGLGVGLSLGYDGAAAFTASWMSSGAVSVDLSVGLAFPTLDVRVRWYGRTDALSPVVGLGLLSPYGAKDRLDLGLDELSRLYALGECVHVDLGLSWAVSAHLDLFVGVAFVTPVDRDHPDTVLFFPEPAAQVLGYF